jgi:hypothetical protein
MLDSLNSTAASQEQLHDLNAAKTEAERISELAPGFSLEQTHMSCVYAYDADTNRFIDG